VTLTVEAAEKSIRRAFQENGIPLRSIDVRRYPQETAFIVFVTESNLRRGATLGNELDEVLADGDLPGFVAVRVAPAAPGVDAGPIRNGVQNQRAVDLEQLLTSRARTSEAQPSLAYIPNAAANVATVVAPRHHLIFGRRGAGKTALLVEAKRRAEAQGAVTVWTNVQTYRREPPERIFLWTAERLSDEIFVNAGKSSSVAELASSLSSDVNELLGRQEVGKHDVERLIPVIQQLVRRFQDFTGRRVFIFLDDFYYVPRGSQPTLLDMLHGCVRDCDAWLKVATIRNLTRWFQPSPPTGLQTGQDADHIDLDVTLEDPQRAKAFLEAMLSAYAADAHVRTLSHLFAPEALDRLVLASGAVPRDYP
jgi:hypothetical protein